MSLSKELPPRRPGETAHYQEDPFELGAIDDEQLIVVDDFLPRPEELAFRPKGVKVTLTLSEDSLNYFKEQAELLNTPYQRMIRNLIDAYVKRQQTRA